MIRIKQKKSKLFQTNTVSMQDVSKLTDRQIDNLIYVAETEKAKREFEKVYNRTTTMVMRVK